MFAGLGTLKVQRREERAKGLQIHQWVRLHRDRRGGAGIGSFKLFDIFIIGHGEMNGSRVDKLAWPVSVTDVSDTPKTLRR